MRTEYLMGQAVEDVLHLLTYGNRIVCRVLLHTGLRISDVLELKTAQLKPNFWITEKKTGRRRQVGLPEPLLSDVMEQAGPFWAFPGDKPGKHRTRQAVWKDVKRAAQALRLNVNAAPHSLRKVYAVELLARYRELDRVRRALNHSSAEVTMIYAMADRLLRERGSRKKRRSGAGRA